MFLINNTCRFPKREFANIRNIYTPSMYYVSKTMIVALKKKALINQYFLNVARLGLEPRLFCTKSRRVANYTIGHSVKRMAKITINS